MICILHKRGQYPHFYNSMGMYCGGVVLLRRALLYQKIAYILFYV